jgi:hypothetical protein
MVISLLSSALGLASEFVEDKDKKNELAHQMVSLVEKNAHEVALTNLKIREREAQHRSVWVAGARPGLMWVCVAGLSLNFVVQPVIQIIMVNVLGLEYKPVVLDVAGLMSAVGIVLGIGGYRSFEKYKGLTK